LKKDGYNVSIVQNRTLSLKGDVDATKHVIDAQDGPVILVGHSYGGAVITEAGTSTKVAALVYIAAFAPEAAFMADSQVPWGVDAFSGSITDPAWRAKSSWDLVATQDRMIPPPAQHQMAERAGSTVVEVAGSHAIYMSQPQAVAALIAQAASAVTTAAVGASAR
jgi:pimeloyl-ACP methyl ester carboxylesterase